MSDISSDRSSPDALADEQRGWLQVLRNKLGLTGPQTLRDTLEGVLKAPDTNAAFSDAERGMLSRLLRFGASRVDDIMVPRADITALDETEPISELLNTFIEAGVSRIPIFRETLDDPRGMIHIKDLFGWLVAEAKGRDASAGGNAANASVAAAQPGSHVAAPLNLGSVDLSRPIAAAKIRCAEAAEKAAAIAHQVFGAIGFTREHILHRFTQRALGWRDDFGNESDWAVRLGRSIAARGADALWPLVASR